MIRSVRIPLTPTEAIHPESIRSILLSTLGISAHQLIGYLIRKRSIDARHRLVRVVLTLDAFIEEPLIQENPVSFEFPVLKPGAKKVVVVGAGPAGLFAALKLIQAGIQPIVLERGKDVRSRRRDLATLNKQGRVDPDSNYCFGEAVPAPTATASCIPAVRNEAIWNESSGYLFFSAHPPRSSSMPIHISEPISYPASSPPCEKPSSRPGVKFILKPA